MFFAHSAAAKTAGMSHAENVNLIKQFLNLAYNKYRGMQKGNLWSKSTPL
jgi:hypothetical protein